MTDKTYTLTLTAKQMLIIESLVRRFTHNLFISSDLDRMIAAKAYLEPRMRVKSCYHRGDPEPSITFTNTGFQSITLRELRDLESTIERKIEDVLDDEEVTEP